MEGALVFHSRSFMHPYSLHNYGTLFFLHFSQEKTFWLQLQAKVNASIPPAVIPMLEAVGCDNEAALRGISTEKLERLQDFARRILSKVSNISYTNIHIFGKVRVRE